MRAVVRKLSPLDRAILKVDAAAQLLHLAYELDVSNGVTGDVLEGFGDDDLRWGEQDEVALDGRDISLE
jgi:hypothetical protein